MYSTASLQFRVSNYQVLWGRYNFNLRDFFSRFKDSLPQDLCQEFAAIQEEGKIVARG